MPEERFVSQELVHLAMDEPGENVSICVLWLFLSFAASVQTVRRERSCSFGSRQTRSKCACDCIDVQVLVSKQMSRDDMLFVCYRLSMLCICFLSVLYFRKPAETQCQRPFLCVACSDSLTRALSLVGSLSVFYSACVRVISISCSSWKLSTMALISKSRWHGASKCLGRVCFVCTTAGVLPGQSLMCPVCSILTT